MTDSEKKDKFYLDVINLIDWRYENDLDFKKEFNKEWRKLKNDKKMKSEVILNDFKKSNTTKLEKFIWLEETTLLNNFEFWEQHDITDCLKLDLIESRDNVL